MWAAAGALACQCRLRLRAARAGRAARDPPRHTVAASHPSQTVGPIGTRRQLSLKRDGGAWTAGRALLLLALLLLLLALALVRAIARGGGADRRALGGRAAAQSVAPPPPPPPPPRPRRARGGSADSQTAPRGRTVFFRLNYSGHQGYVLLDLTELSSYLPLVPCFEFGNASGTLLPCTEGPSGRSCLVPPPRDPPCGGLAMSRPARAAAGTDSGAAAGASAIAPRRWRAAIELSWACYPRP